MKLPVPPSGAVRAGLPILAIAAAFGAGAWFGLEIGLLVAAGGSLLGVIGLSWASVQSLTGDSPLTLDEALTLGAPSAEEEQKRSVLRALKDLEFERSVGKISDADYAELSTRYRAEAKRLIQMLDESLTPARERAEKLVAERLRAGGSTAPERQAKSGGKAEAGTASRTPADAEAGPAESAPEDSKANREASS